MESNNVRSFSDAILKNRFSKITEDILKELKEIYDENEITDDKFKEIFIDICLRCIDDSYPRMACESPDYYDPASIDLVKWVYSLRDIKIDLTDLFLKTCDNRILDVTKWLYSLGNINIHIKDDLAFRSACNKGNLELAQWLYSLGNIDIHAKYDDAYISSSSLKIIEWLNSLDTFSLETINNKFISSSQHESIDLILYIYEKHKKDIFKEKFLFNREKIDSNKKYYEVFNFLINNKRLLSTARNNKINITKFNNLIKEVYHNASYDLYKNNNEYFLFFCKENNTELAQWIYLQGNVNININNNIAFIWCIKNKNNELLTWIFNRNQIIIKFDINFYKDIIDRLFPSFCNWSDDWIFKAGIDTISKILLIIIDLLKSKKKYNIKFINCNNIEIEDHIGVIKILYYQYKHYLLDIYLYNSCFREHFRENIDQKYIDFNKHIEHFYKLSKFIEYNEEKPQPKKTTKETNKVKEILKQVIEKEELDELHLKKSKESPKKKKSKSEKMTDI